LTKKKSFEDGNVIKECYVVEGDLLFKEFKIKTEMCSALKEFQLSQSTVTKRVECYCGIEQKLRQDLDIC
jgi:hypothetical protein